MAKKNKVKLTSGDLSEDLYNIPSNRKKNKNKNKNKNSLKDTKINKNVRSEPNNFNRLDASKNKTQKIDKAEYQKSLNQKDKVINVFMNNGNTPLHYKDVTLQTGIIVHNVRRILGQNVIGKTKKPVFARISPGVYKLLETKEYELALKPKNNQQDLSSEAEKVNNDTSLNQNFANFANLYTVDSTPERKTSIEILNDLLIQLNQYIPKNYKSKVGVGIGKATPTPWIGFRDPSYSKSFTKGIYIFYSLSEDKKFIYLSVGQGTYELKKEVGGPAARKQLLSNTASIQHILKDTIKAFNYDKSID